MIECRDIESRMMDWLYQELDQTDSAEFRDHLSSCSSCEEELRSLEATREAFSQLPSEEPPASVSAILLHEAAKSAPAKVAAREPLEESSGGLWAWFIGLLTPIAAHPAAAAVASLVLVAGVAGTLYVTKGDQMARPELARSAETGDRYIQVQPGAGIATPAATDEENGEAAPALADLDVPEPAPAASTATPSESFEADLLGSDDSAELRQKVVADSKRRQEQTRGRKGKSVSSGVVATKKPKRRAKTNAPAPAANAISGADPLITLDEGGSAPTDGKKDANRGKRSSNELALEKSQSDKDATYRAYKQREQKWIKTQRAALKQAVKKEDCRRAARIANDILDRNRDYYTKSVSKDVKRCSWYVSDERQRRAKSRNAKRATKKKRKSKAAGVPSKAKAAPRKDAFDSATE